MYLTVGEISKILGISNEMIRFYIRKGIIRPQKNAENNYWQYSSDDLLILSDIVFYRLMDFHLKDIKKILDGLPCEEIGSIISARKKELEEEIAQKQQTLKELAHWEQEYQLELRLLTSFTICKMPPNLRRMEFYSEADHLADYFPGGSMDRMSLSYMSLSIFCDLCAEPPEIKRYLAFSKTRETEHLHEKDYVLEEEPEDCFCTQVPYHRDGEKMLEPVLRMAHANGIALAGRVYFFENTNYYEDGERKGLFRAYAPLKTEKSK